jgi:NAD(P)-dependent dehydrogenase (short-subunit alcohol dehydrogenase family)
VSATLTGVIPATRPIALITGASRGLGKHGALALAAKGVDLIITYRSQAAEAEAVVTQARALGVRAHALALDVGESATFRAFAEEVTQLLAREWQRTHFNFLVNNAGIGIHASFEQTTEQQFDTLLNIHLKGTFFLTQALLPSGRRRSHPQPLHRPHPLRHAGLCRLRRHEGASRCSPSIWPRSWAPGASRSTCWPPAPSRPILAAAWCATTRSQRLSREPDRPGRVGQPDDIGGAIAALLSDDCRWITAQRIEASGGMFI